MTIAAALSIGLLHAQIPQEKGLQSINRASAEAIVGFLADDELQGREAGQHGSRIAARYLAACLKEAGVAPLLESGYLQTFEACAPERQRRGRWQVHPDSIARLKQGTHRTMPMANVLGIPLDILVTEQGPGYGGALLAMVCCGKYATVQEATNALVHVSRTIEPDSELTALYEERYQKFKQIYPTCKPLFKALAE